MYAVIKAGGKQHKVKTGDVLEIELMHADGDTVTFQPLLVVDDDGKTHYGKEAAQAVVTAKLLGSRRATRSTCSSTRTSPVTPAGEGQLMTLIEIADVKLERAQACRSPEAGREAGHRTCQGRRRRVRGRGGGRVAQTSGRLGRDGTRRAAVRPATGETPSPSGSASRCSVRR